MRNILLFFNDIQKYPPILSIIDVLLAHNHEVIVLGYCSNKHTIKNLKDKGLKYYEITIDQDKANPFLKLFRILEFKKKAYKLVPKLYKQKNTKLWIFGNRATWVLPRLVKQYEAIIYLFETPELKIHPKFRIISPFINYFSLMQSAWKVVCCERNRAAITQSYFQLNKMPLVVPNKPSLKIDNLKPLKEINSDLYEVCKNKKVILYQGIFVYPERRLEELCESISYLSEDFIIVLMGGDSKYKRYLQKKYESSKIIFTPFIPSPNHLSMTKISYIGFLTYHAPLGDIENSINTLYCAPNKIYEYSLFDKPMLSTNNPALHEIYEKYHIGRSLDDFSPKNIAKVILDLDKYYKEYSANCNLFYNAIDIENLILDVINE